MISRVVVRMKSKLSFSGVPLKEDSFFIKLKLSDKSQMQLLIPKDEIDCIISNNKNIEVK